MAIYNEILSARFPKLAQKLFSMKGEQAVKQLTGELTLVQNLPFGVEHRFLMTESRFGAFAGATGAAGQFVAFRLRNPSNSGLVAIVEKLQVSSGTAQSIAIDLSSVNALGDFGTVLPSQRLDARLGAAPQSSLTNTQTATKPIALGATIAQISAQANVGFDLILTDDQELAILPGDAFGVGNTVAASQMQWSVWWRERPLEESETK